jgi:hypothetical protein
MLSRFLAWLKSPDADRPVNGALRLALPQKLPPAQAAADAIRIEELSEASAIAGPLFLRKFGQNIPDFPRHFVAMIGDSCAGYVHYTAWQGDYLCGGLCIDERAYRALSVEQRHWVRQRGGIAEIMLRHAHAALGDAATIWGYVGDKQAEAVDRRVGFEKVAEPYLFAIWRTNISDTEKQSRVAEVQKIGPF